MMQAWLAYGICLLALFCASCGGDDAYKSRSTCTGYSTPSSSNYKLPYTAGETYQVLQSNCTDDTHNGGWRYGYDFDMAVGTTVIAARAGTVIALEESIVGESHLAENYVNVQHADGTVARYKRFATDGVTVALNAAVNQGDTLGTVGNTNNSSKSHLHFDVVENSTSTTTMAVTFSNAGTSSAAALSEGQNYTAQ